MPPFTPGQDESARDAVPRLVRRSCHVLRTLEAKRSSLRSALGAFGEASAGHAAEFAPAAAAASGGGDDDGGPRRLRHRRQSALQHWFACLVRLRDGFVLLESGERRHPHDGDDESGTNVSEGEYASTLASSGYRSDGRTRKFSSLNGYSGGGYDEFWDEDAGIRLELLGLLAGLAGGGTRPEAVWDRLLETGAQAFEGMMDGHIEESKRLRDELNGIQRRFIADVNSGLSKAARKGGGKADSVRLVVEDKSERLTWGLVDISRKGNQFTLPDEGGSLPYGMTEASWRKKFAFKTPSAPQQKPKTTAAAETARTADINRKKKKRRQILEDSSSEEEDSAVTAAPPPRKKLRTKGQTVAVAAPGDGMGTGLEVRERRKTDVATSNAHTTSVHEMKRQLGVDDARLEAKRDIVVGEERASRITGEEDDLREALDAGGGAGGAPSSLRAAARACMDARAALQDERVCGYNPDFVAELSDRFDEFWDDYRVFTGAFEEWTRVRREVGDGSVEEFSDEAYGARENYREGVMQLGIVAVDLSVFVSSQLQDKQMGVECLIAHSSPSFEARLCGPTDNSSPPDICRSYLRFAVELFKSALGLVKEHERHQTKLQTDVQTHWENRQHLLLRGRAQHNLGRALFELAQLKARSKQGRPVNGMSHFKSPGNEFQKAVETARQIRNDSRAVESHAEAPASPWVSKARLQALDALGLEALASGLLAECFLKTNRVNDAMSLLSSVFDSIALSAIASADEDNVDSEVVAHALEELYLFAMTVAESSTRILEASVGSKIMCAEFGAQCLALTKLALEHASSVSDVLLPYIDQHSLDVEVTIASRSSIEREENAILHWWQSVKDQGRNLVSSSAVSARDIANTLPRPDLAATTAREMDLLHPPPLVRRSFVLDSHSLQRRSRQATTSSNRRNDKDARVRKDLASAATKEVEQRKWGDEMLTKQLRRCCPPLPRVNEDLGITTKVLDALKKKLGNVLPCDEYGHVYCQ